MSRAAESRRATFDRELVRRYDRPVPRYTSYPSAPHFSDAFGPPEHRRLLAGSRGPLSLYLHVPFCKTRCFFCGCNVEISRSSERAARYLDALDREMATIAAELAEGERRAAQLHLGGGTPNFLTPQQIRRLWGMLRGHFAIDPRAEISVEIDPRRCTDEHLDAFAEGGVRRLSFGVQDLDPQVQAAINRVQPPAEVRRVVEGARRRGIESVNLDLIYGLPHQTPERFAATLDEVIAISPDRIALFNFAYLPEVFRHQRVIDPQALPDAETKLTLLEQSVETLSAAGWLFLGMDHFAKPGDSLVRAFDEGRLTRNFQGYSTGGDLDLVAFGASAISGTRDGFAQNRKDADGYQQAVAGGGLATVRGHFLSAEDRLRRGVILGLMSRFELVKTEVEERFAIDFDRHFADELKRLEPLADDGLVELAPDALRVTPSGRFLVRNVAAVFDAYLGAGRVTYSRAV